MSENKIVYLNESKSQLVCNSYKFQFDSRPRSNGSRYFHCVEHKDLKCAVTISLKNDEIASMNGKHNHKPMFAVEEEYLVSVQHLKQICSSVSMQEVKSRYEAIHSQLDKKYGTEILTPFWRSWSSIRTTFSKIQSTSKKCPTISKKICNIPLQKITIIGNSKNIILMKCRNIHIL